MSAAAIAAGKGTQQAALRELPQWSRMAFERHGCSSVLASRRAGRAHSGLGGSHTVVTYPPLDALAPLAPGEISDRAQPSADLHLYAHVAFCEFMCPFCHYATTYTPLARAPTLIGSYMEALREEVMSWRRLLRGSRLGSLYIGGGTPTALPGDLLLGLIASLREAYAWSPGVRACLEASPLTAESADGKAKLGAAVEAGINRISIGVQTFDDVLSQRTRGHLRETTIRALETVLGLGVEVNIDLIQDLPDQTDESLVGDLLWVQAFRPEQITWYVLRFRPEAAWYGRYRRGDLAVASEEESVRRRLMIREGMRRLGYHSRPGERFVREDTVRDGFKDVRAGTDRILVGMGVSAYSHGWGYFFRNLFGAARGSGRRAGIPDYIRSVRETGWAIEAGQELTELELTAGRLVKGIRSGMVLPEPTERTDEYLSGARRTLEGLVAQGLVELQGGVYFLTELGSLFEEEICTMFYSPTVKQRLRSLNEFWEP